MNVFAGLRRLRENRVLAPLRTTIDSFLQEFQSAPILYYPNPGNAGDSLIAAATLEAFRRNGVKARAIGLEDAVEGEVVFLGGGGNLIPLYHQMAAAFDAFVGRARRLVLLPHTIRGSERVLGRLDPTCTIFCRDRPSYNHVLSARPSLDVRLAHDMAFHLDAAGFLRDGRLRRQGAPLWRAKLGASGLDKAALRAVVNLSRLDVESRLRIPQSDADISHLFTFGTAPEQARLGAWCFLKTISLAARIVTDRLHVGIGAALLGVPCDLYDNSYGKNAAVYEYSLAGRFANVRFRPD